MAVGKAEILVVADAREFDRQMKRMGDSADNEFKRTSDSARNNFDKAEQSAKRSGPRMGAAIGAGAGAAVGALAAIGAVDYFGEAVRGAFSLERGLTEIVNVATAGDFDPKVLKVLEDTTKTLQTEFGILSADAVPAMYNAVSAGVDANEDFEKFMETAAKNAAVNLSSLETSIDGLTTVMNIFGIEAADADDIMDIFTATVNNGKTTLDELGPAIAQPSAAAVQMGIDFDQVGAALAAMTAQGVGTAESATRLTRFIEELGNSTSKSGKVFEEVAGESFQAFIDGGGTVQEAADLIAAHVDEAGLTLGQVFSSSEAAAAAFFLQSTDGADKFADVMGQTFDEFVSSGGSVQDAMAAMGQAAEDMGLDIDASMFQSEQAFLEFVSDADGASNTFANTMGDIRAEGSLTEGAMDNLAATGDHQMAQLAGAFEAVQLEIGKALGPIVLQLVGELIPVIESLAPIVVDVAGTAAEMFTMIFDAIKPLLPPLTDIVSQLLPILADLFGTLLGAAMPLVEVLLTLLVAVLEPLLPALVPLLEVFAELAVQLSEVLTPIIEIVGEILLWLVNEVIVPYLIPIIVFVADLWGTVLAKYFQVGGAIVQTVIEAVVIAAKWLKEQFDRYTQALRVTWALVSTKFKEGWDAIRTRVFDPLKSGAASVRDTLKGIWDRVKSAFQTVVDKFKTGADKIKGYFNGIWDAIKGAYNALASGWNRIKVEIGPYNIPDWVPIVGGKKFHIPDLIPNIPKLQESGFSLGTGVALLHPNEAIVNTRDPRGIRMLADALDQAGARSGVTIERGAVVINISGDASIEQARRVGQAAGDTLVRTISQRTARLVVRNL